MSIILPKAEYKGYDIEWQDFGQKFRIGIGGDLVGKAYSTLEECEKWIDAKTKEKFKRITVFFSDWSGKKFRPAEATSVVDAEHVWVVTTDNKERSKAPLNRVYLASPENCEKVDQIENIRKQIIHLEQERDEIISGMEKLTVEMMKE